MAEKLYVKQNLRANKSNGFARPTTDVDGRQEKTFVNATGEYVRFVIDMGAKGTYTWPVGVADLKGFNKNPLRVDENGKEYVKEGMMIHLPASQKEEPTFHEIEVTGETEKVLTPAQIKAAEKKAAKELATA